MASGQFLTKARDVNLPWTRTVFRQFCENFDILSDTIGCNQTCTVVTALHCNIVVDWPIACLFVLLFFFLSYVMRAVILKRLFTKSNLPRELLLPNAKRNGLSYFQVYAFHRMGSCSKGKQNVHWLCGMWLTGKM